MTVKQTFELTDDHIKLMREFTFIWDFGEGGAPVVDSSRVYGSKDQYGDMRRILGKKAQKVELDTLQTELNMAFEIALQHTMLLPGDYTYLQVTSNETDTDLGEEILSSKKTIIFRFTEQHLKLLHAANGGWLEYWETLGINSKHPYGDMSFFELDMVDLLGMSVPPCTARNEVEFPKEQLHELNQLHKDTLHALPILLKYGTLKTGHYDREDEYSPWQFVG